MKRVGTFSVIVWLLAGAVGSASAETEAQLEPDEMVLPKPEPGVERVQPMAAPWCRYVDDVPRGQRAGRAYARQLSLIERWGWTDELITKLASYACSNPSDPNYQKQTAGLIQGWANSYGLTEKEAIFAITLRVQQAKWESQKAKFCNEDLGELDEEARLPEQVRYYTLQHIACSGDWADGGRSGEHDAFEWYYDRLPDAPSELLRARFLLRCFGIHDQAAPNNYHQLAAYAMCGLDAEMADPAQFAKEIAGYNDYFKVNAREYYGLARKRAAMFKAAAQARAKKTPELHKLVFELPLATYRDWKATYADNKAAVDAALDFEARFFAPNRNATQGCWEPLHDQLVAYVGKHKPKSIEDVERAATEPIATLLTERLVACGVREERVNTGYITELHGIAPDARGWHMLLLNRIIDSLNDIRADRPRFPLDPKEHFFGQGTRPSPILSMIGSYTRGGRSHIEEPPKAGEIKSVKKTEDGLYVTFKPVKYKYMARECKDTNRIMRIEPNGNVVYYQTCRNLGMRTETVTLPPTTIPFDQALGIKKKAFVQLALESHVYRYGELHRSVATVYAVYKSSKKRKLISAFGFKVGK